MTPRQVRSSLWPCVCLTIAAAMSLAPRCLAVDLQLTLTGQVNVNGSPITISGTGTLDTVTGAYQLEDAAPAGGQLSARDKLLLAIIPRATQIFLVENGGPSLLAQSPTETIQGQLSGGRKVEATTQISADFNLSQNGLAVTIGYTGSITSMADRPIEADGESVIRLGVNPEDRSFVGGARINYDATQPDPLRLGTADFWNLSGTFSGAQAPVTQSYGHVDQGAGNPSIGLAQGTLLLFQETTVFQAAVITLSGTATQPSQITQYFGIANQTGGGITHIKTLIAIPPGTTAAQAATIIQDTINAEATALGVPLLAVQGGDGSTITVPDPTSPRVAFSMSLDGSTIAQPQDPVAAAVFTQVATQSFPDWEAQALALAGLRNQFGVVGDPALPGWLTPFKIEINADNPGTGFVAAGGDVRILLNWCDRLPGGACVPGTTTSFSDLVIPTTAGETQEIVAANATDLLRTLVTLWNTQPLTQRSGNRIYVDAGIEFPHSVSFDSNDNGIGYVSAAADLPFFNPPEIIPTVGQWGLIILALGLLICGVIALKRRRVAPMATS